MASPSKAIESESPSSQGNSKVDITLIEEYKTKLDGFFHLAIALDGSMWIINGDPQKGMRLFSSQPKLQKVKCKGNKLKVKSTFNIDIWNIAFTPGNDLIIATDGPILKQIKIGRNKIVDTLYDIEPYKSLSIHVTSKNKMIVGTGEKLGLVIVMDHDGNHEKDYGADQTTGTLFTYPSKITAASNNGIFVSGEKSGTKECVVVLGQEGIINTYCGFSAINTENNPFKRSDFATTSADNVIDADDKSSTFHILNSSGHLITYICLKDKGIQAPISIELAMTGHFCMLYIGTFEYGSNDDKLYKLNMIGC